MKIPATGMPTLNSHPIFFWWAVAAVLMAFSIFQITDQSFNLGLLPDPKMIFGWYWVGGLCGGLSFAALNLSEIQIHRQRRKLDAWTVQLLQDSISQIHEITMGSVTVTPIRTKEDHERALIHIQQLWESEEGTPEFDLLGVLVDMVHAYEQKHYPMGEETLCGSCGEEAVTWKVREQEFPYGVLPDTVFLKAVVPVATCGACGLSYTDEHGEALREAAVSAHLMKVTPK